jgi:hypothetical protein
MPETQPQRDILQSSSTADSSAATPSAPTNEPPASAKSGATGGIGATVWVSGKKINALWAINENRNSWVSVAGVGWTKLANNSDTAIVALTILATNARQTQGDVSYRQEADNMIHEIYVW